MMRDKADILRSAIRHAPGTVLKGSAFLDPAAPQGGVVEFGVPEIDSALPWGGLPRGGLHEIAGPPGQASLFGFAAALVGRLDGPVLWCRCRRDAEAGLPYGPGLARFGLPPRRLILAEAARPAETLWAMEEGLRCRGLSAVLSEGVAPDLTASRRLQLAAEAGGTLALMLTPTASPPTSAALTRWRVVTAQSMAEAGGPGRARWRVSLLRCRGGTPRDWHLEWDDEALCFSVAAALADRPLALAAG
ncbi:MAG TPA: damage-inducible mutagenesis protein [Alphaproteobacteria bacterium]|nr:damage-inducible mutagenesis protein [Alphaproteobacteria bacterium]